jgi:2-dehydropantoate 2-reductase
MKILFFGRGVISTQYAWAFEKAGHTIDFYVRKGRKETFGNSIDLEIWDARKGKVLVKEKWKTNLHEEIGRDYDLIIVSVNTEQMPEAVKLLSTAESKTPILFFNNIWQDLATAIAPLSMNRVVFGFPGAGGGITDNKLRGGFLKMVFLEKPRSEVEEINKMVRDLFESANFKISSVKDMQSWLWDHFAMNAAMEGEVLKKGSFPGLMNSSDSFVNVGLNMREIIPVLTARGAKPSIVSAFIAKAPQVILNVLFNNIIFAKGALARLFMEYNNSKAGFAVSEVVKSAEKFATPVPRLQKSLEYYK